MVFVRNNDDGELSIMIKCVTFVSKKKTVIQLLMIVKVLVITQG